MNSLDNPELWKEVVLRATTLGIADATTGRKPRTEVELVTLLREPHRFGQFGYRHGHARNLRQAYGAGFNGIAITKRATAVKA